MVGRRRYLDDICHAGASQSSNRADNKRTPALLGAGDVERTDTSRGVPSALNELGVGGVGESGTHPVRAAVAVAIDCAHSNSGVHEDCMPMSYQALSPEIGEAIVLAR